MTRIPKLKVPLQMGAHGLQVVEQDSDEEVRNCAYAVMATPLGSRFEEPDFGVTDPTFEQLPLDDREWLDALATWEPRAEVATNQELEELVADVVMEVGAR